jgi:CheY-like chemotaxis protein
MHLRLPKINLNSSHQLLIIEDDEEMSNYVSSVVTQAGQPVTAANGEAGFKMAVDIIPDLIICDVMMPGSDGITCCERLKSDPRTDHIPIILLTAKAELADRWMDFVQGQMII